MILWSNETVFSVFGFFSCRSRLELQFSESLVVVVFVFATSFGLWSFDGAGVGFLWASEDWVAGRTPRDCSIHNIHWLVYSCFWLGFSSVTFRIPYVPVRVE